MESFMFLGFGLDAWITIITVLGMFTVLLFTKLRSDLVFLGAIAILYITGVLTDKEAFSGFSATSVITIGVLFVVVAGLMHTGVLQWMVKHLLGQPNSYAKAVTRLMLPVAALSSFLSNTTVVALFVNIVKMWAKKRISLQAAYSSKLCFWYGWRLHAYRHSAEHDYQRTLCRQDGRSHEHFRHNYPWPVLPCRRRAFGHRYAPLPA